MAAVLRPAQFRSIRLLDRELEDCRATLAQLYDVGSKVLMWERIDGLLERREELRVRGKQSAALQSLPPGQAT